MPSLNNQQKIFFGSEKSTTEFLNNFQLLFGGEWKENSAWEKCSSLIENANEFMIGGVVHDRGVDFFWTVIEFVDSPLLFEINNSIKNIVNLLNTQPNGERIENKNKVNFEEICDRLEVSEIAKSFFLNKIEFLTGDNKNKVMNELNNLVSLYEKVRPNIMLVAASLLHHIENEVPTTVAEFKEKITFSGVVDYSQIKNYVPLLRYLGQSFFGKDTEVALVVYDLLSELMVDNNIVKKGIINKVESKLLFTVLLLIVFDHFSNFTVDEMDVLVGNFGWYALDAGFPLVELLQEYLADQPNLIEYINQSGIFADDLLNSVQLLFPHEGEIDVVVGTFLRVYVEFAKDKEFDKVTQNKYIDIELKVHKWQEEERDKLLTLINLYIHLRECDLIDYHGLLSDEGVIKKQYDWVSLLKEDISDEKIQEIKRYFGIVHRPFRIKMELSRAFRLINMEDEVFLSRVLLLNNAFEDVYGHTYSPLVYFDESDVVWKLNDIVSDELLNEFDSRISRLQQKNLRNEK